MIGEKLGHYRLTARNTNDSLVVWDVETGKNPPHLGEVGWSQAVAFSPEGKFLVSQGKGFTIHVLDVANGKEVRKVARKNWASHWTFSGDGKLLALADPGMLTVLDSQTFLALPQFGGDQRWSFTALAMAPNGKLAASGGWDGPTLWNTATGKRIQELNAKQGKVISVTFSPNGKWLASCGEDKSVCIWDVDGMKLERRLEGRIGAVRAVFSPDNSQLAWSEPGAIHFTEVASGKELRFFPLIPAETAISLAFSPNGKALAGAETEGFLRIWEVGSGNILQRLPGHQGDITLVAFAADGKTLWSNGIDGTVRRWDPNSGKEGAGLAKGSMQILAMSPTGKMLETGKDGMFRVWDATTMNACRWHRTDAGRIVSASFSSDGRQLATGGSDGAALIWDVDELCK